MSEQGSEWKTLSTDPDVRMRAIRDYAANVLGSPAAATRWLQSVDPAVQGGRLMVIDACATPVGFYEAMAELARINQFAQREARKRARMENVATLVARGDTSAAPSPIHN